MSDTAPRFMRLDNAANIYPPNKTRNWTALFRISAELTEPVDPELLKAAAKSTAARFPSMSVKIRRGFFWRYMERIHGDPPVTPDGCCPCEPLRPEEYGGYAFRVRYYERRIAVEFFHALTDGTGAMCFFKTLLAEYLTLKHGITVERGGDILDCGEPAKPEEYEDSFVKYAGTVMAGIGEKNSFRIKGRPEPDGFNNQTLGIIPVSEILKLSREKGVTLTQYLAAVMILAMDSVQRREVRYQSRMKPVKVCIPVNLRSFFKSSTLRNFATFVNPGIDPRMGEYTFDEVLSAVYHQMGAEVTEKNLRAKISVNVRSSNLAVFRIMPLVIKDPVLKMVFKMAGDRKTCTTLTNLGNITLPPEMAARVARMELILGPLSVNPVACALLSYNGLLYVSFTRTIDDPKVEREFFTRLVKLGIPVRIESNSREQE